MMEADSTTVEQEFSDGDSHRDVLLIDELSRNYDYFRTAVLPLLELGQEKKLLDWMRKKNLIQKSMTCPKNLPDCSMSMVRSKVVDKYQWRCDLCQFKTPIRDNSFFKNVYCSLRTVLKIILAWCHDVDYEYLAHTFDTKKQIVNSIYEKIEKTVYSRPSIRFGGYNVVLLVELYPDFVEELYPVSSRNDSAPKTQHKILCIADTREIPTRYWLHVINGTIVTPTENNNKTIKKATLCEESLNIIKNIALPGSLCAVGGGANLTSLRESLQACDSYSGVTSMNNVTTCASADMQAFLKNTIWKPVIGLCEAAQDLPKSKMQSYLSCALWRWQKHSPDSFLSVVELIAEQDYKNVNSKGSNKVH